MQRSVRSSFCLSWTQSCDFAWQDTIQRMGPRNMGGICQKTDGTSPGLWFGWGYRHPPLVKGSLYTTAIFHWYLPPDEDFSIYRNNYNWKAPLRPIKGHPIECLSSFHVQIKHLRRASSESESAGWGGGLKICISNRLSGDMDASGHWVARL